MRKSKCFWRGWAAGWGHHLPLAAALLLTACAAGPELEVSGITLIADPGANGDTPIRVDLVLVSDRKLLEDLLRLPAGEWFKRKSQYQRDYPEALAVFDWEIVPGSRTALDLPERPAAWAGLVYAGYASAGDHRLLVRAPLIKLRFSESDFLPLP